MPFSSLAHVAVEICEDIVQVCVVKSNRHLYACQIDMRVEREETHVVDPRLDTFVIPFTKDGRLERDLIRHEMRSEPRTIPVRSSDEPASNVMEGESTYEFPSTSITNRFFAISSSELFSTN